MILTCPACGTSYTVKDGAIPPAGRQVRCAACRHSWHQEGAGEAAAPVVEERVPTPVEAVAGDHAEPVQTEADAGAAEAQEPEAEPEIASDVPYAADEPIGPAESEALSTIDVRAAAPAASPEPVVAADDGYNWDHARDEDPSSPRRRGLIVVAALILIVGALAAAAWFLAPAEWLSRAGLAQNNASSPLKLMVTSQDRQKLASGNDLVSLSGRVINPTDATQNVPPLQADLRNGAGKLVYSWTIAPPAASLPPRASASFNAAELGVPADATSLTLRWAS